MQRVFTLGYAGWQEYIREGVCNTHDSSSVSGFDVTATLLHGH